LRLIVIGSASIRDPINGQSGLLTGDECRKASSPVV